LTWRVESGWGNIRINDFSQWEVIIHRTYSSDSLAVGYCALDVFLILVAFGHVPHIQHFPDFRWLIKVGTSKRYGNKKKLELLGGIVIVVI
jgi:hypothetical protein